MQIHAGTDTWRWERQYASLAARKTRIASGCRICSWGMVAEAINTQVSARDRHMLFYGSRVAMSRTRTAYCAELRLNLASKGEAVLNLCPIFFRSRRWALWSIATRKGHTSAVPTFRMLCVLTVSPLRSL